MCYDVFTPLQMCGAEFGQYPSKGCVNLARVCPEFFRNQLCTSFAECRDGFQNGRFIVDIADAGVARRCP